MKLLSIIEKTGNKLPDPSVLFVFGTVLVFILSMILATISTAMAYWLFIELLNKFGINI